jgi:coenzyme F420-reducing hydrogenase delta subunit
MKLYLFCCSTRIDLEDLERSFSGQNGCEVRVISLPCSGKVDKLYLVKAFETGADGVAVVTCGKGECRYLEGNLRARKRSEAVDALLGEIGMGKGRVTVIQLGEGGMEQAIREMCAFRAAIEQMQTAGRTMHGA